MSYLCETREYILLEGGADLSVRSLVIKRLRSLFRKAAAGSGLIYYLRIRTGSERAEVSGDDSAKAFEEALSLLLVGGETTVTLARLYEEPESAPDVFAKALHDLPAEKRDTVRFVYWDDPLGESMGSVFAYGAAPVNGPVPYVPVDEPSEDGDWFSNCTYFFVEGTEFTPELTEACRALSISAGTEEPEKGFCLGGRYGSPDLCAEGPYPFFTLNHIGLPGRKSVRNFAKHVSPVLKLTGMPAYTAELIDVESEMPRMLRITVSPEGGVRYALSSVSGLL